MNRIIEQEATNVPRETYRQWIEVKVDLINLKAIVRRTEHTINLENQVGKVEKFCLTRDGAWLFVDEGEVYSDVCELPIAHFREQ